MNSMFCPECQKLWFGAATPAGGTRECPDCGSRLMPTSQVVASPASSSSAKSSSR